MKKQTLLVLFGGQSAEHEISVISARNMVAALGADIQPVLVGISRTGTWYNYPSLESLADIAVVSDDCNYPSVTLMRQPNETLLLRRDGSVSTAIDVVFPLLHGPLGEDGCLQGLLRLYNLPFIGFDVTSSALGMDKEVMRRLLEHTPIPMPKFLSVTHPDELSTDTIIQALKLPVFVKPSSMGSSVGIHKVTTEADLRPAIEDALQYSSKVLLENFISGREIECAVLGNASPDASPLGEILPQHDFYSYEAKYLDPTGAELIVPARLDDAVVEQVKTYAIDIFKRLGCQGMARVDFFVQEDNTIVFNEINTIPGFTEISMYPRLWQEAGLAYPDLLNRLISLALDAHQDNSKQKVSLAQ